MCYNSLDDIKVCLDSFYHKDLRNQEWEILIIDNSRDGTIPYVKENYPDVKIIDNNENLGFGKGNNQAAKYAKGEFLFFLNPDTKMRGNTFSRTMDRLRREKRSSFGVKTTFEDGSVEPSSLQFFPLFVNEIPLLNLLIKKRIIKRLNSNSPVERSIVSGAALIIKKDLWERIAGFDECFFMYSEEVDLCRRIRKSSNEKILMIPCDGITHYVGKSTPNDEKRLRLILRGKMHYSIKHYKPIQRVSYKHLLLFSLRLRSMKERILKKGRNNAFHNLIVHHSEWEKGYYL